MNMAAEAEKMHQDFAAAIQLIRKIAQEIYIHRCRQDSGSAIEDAYYDITNECQDFLEDRDL